MPQSHLRPPSPASKTPAVHAPRPGPHHLSSSPKATRIELRLACIIQRHSNPLQKTTHTPFQITTCKRTILEPVWPVSPAPCSGLPLQLAYRFPPLRTLAGGSCSPRLHRVVAIIGTFSRRDDPTPTQLTHYARTIHYPSISIHDPSHRVGIGASRQFLHGLRYSTVP